MPSQSNNFYLANRSLFAPCLLAVALVNLLGCNASSTPPDSGNSEFKVNHPFFIGNIYQPTVTDESVAMYWNQLTPENVGKWPAVEGVRDDPQWKWLDEMYDFANRHNMIVKAHTFVWGATSPSWMGNITPEEFVAELEEWMGDYCARYPETKIIDVVNEALPGHLPSGPAQMAMGQNWIVESFKLARKHCPDAILVLNDYNVLSWSADDFVEFITPLVATGVIDAIGAEAHNLEEIDLELIKANLDRLANFGLPIYISEYDVAIKDDAKQLEIMQAQFPVFYNHPAVVGITFYGHYKGQTWVQNTHLVNEDASPRPALNWLMAYIGDHPKFNSMQ